MLTCRVQWCRNFFDPVNPCRQRVDTRNIKRKCPKCEAKPGNTKGDKKEPNGGGEDGEGKDEEEKGTKKKELTKSKDKPPPKKSALKKSGEKKDGEQKTD